MSQTHAVITALHALAGAVALLAMWIPMFSKKGGRTHRRAGLAFVWAMAVVTVTALAASSLRLVFEPSVRQGPLFLMMVAVLSGAATWWGVSVLRQKGRTTPGTRIPDWIAAVSLVGSGAAGIVGWMSGAMVLFAIFGALEVAIGVAFIRTLRSTPTSRWWWWFEHFFGMIVAAIGAVTAFLVVNYGSAPEAIQRVVPAILVWVLPGVVGGAALTWLKRYYLARLPPGVQPGAPGALDQAPRS